MKFRLSVAILTAIVSIAIISVLVNRRGTTETQDSVISLNESLGAENLKNSTWWRTAQHQLVEGEYRIKRVGAGVLVAADKEVPGAELIAGLGYDVLQTPNRAQNLRFYFLDDQIAAFRRNTTEPDWVLGLTTQSVNRGGGSGVLEGLYNDIFSDGPKTEAARVEYHHSGYIEWFENSPAGLEHGFNIEQSPDGDGPLTIEVEVTGLIPIPSLNGTEVELHLPEGGMELTYGKLKAYDANGTTLPASFLVASNSIIIEVEDYNAVYPIVVDPLLSTPAALLEINQPYASFGFSVAGAGDVNGDGFTDIIVGASMLDATEPDSGSAYVYLGSAAGLQTDYSWTIAGTQLNEQLGYSVAGAGDVNGDGFADVIVGARNYSNGEAEEGAAFLFLGSASGLSETANWSAESDQAGANFGISVAGVGDVDSDGYSDIVIGASTYDNGHSDEGRAYLFSGTATGPSGTATWTAESGQDDAQFATTVAGAGDVNGDGYFDVVIGAPQYSNGQNAEGRVYVFFGSGGGLSVSADWTAESGQADAAFGASVAGVGDVDGDGYADLLIGAAGYSNGEANEGAAFLYLGSTTGPEAGCPWSVEGDQANAQFGGTVAAAGDVNGDGYADLVIGSQYYDNGESDEGAVFIFYGSGTGPGPVPDLLIDSDQADSLFGAVVAGAGDIDGDGFGDVIVGAPQFTAGQYREGRALVFNGSAAGVSLTSNWSADGDQTEAYFGSSAAGAGDVNGDGYDDVIVGAPYYDNGEINEGQVFLFFGSSSGISTSPDWFAEGNQYGARFGTSVAGAGDINGDGYDDVVVGADNFTNGENGEGAAFVFHGSSSGLSSTADWIFESNQDGAYLGSAVAGAGDVNGDGYADVVIGAKYYEAGQNNEGRAYVFHGSASGLPSTEDWSQEGDLNGAFFGHSVASAGDINGDGYADIIVGSNEYTNGAYREGAAFVYYGSATGLSLTADWSGESDKGNAYYGQSVASAGDVNGDGFADVLVGAYSYTEDISSQGRVYLYYGSAAGLSATADWSVKGDSEYAYLGSSVAGVGDVNADGYDDVLLGAISYSNGQMEEGCASIYHGSSSGLSATADWTVEGNQIEANYGSTVAGLGDVNGDGYSDVLVAALRFDNGETDEGAVNIYYGNKGSSLSGTIAEQRNLADTGLISQANSVHPEFLVKLTDRSTVGRTLAAIQYEIKPRGTGFDGTDLVTAGTFGDTSLVAQAYSLSALLNEEGGYHWRARLVYNPATVFNGQSAGRWFRPLFHRVGLQDIRLASIAPSIDSVAVLDSVDETSSGNSVDIEVTVSDADGDDIIIDIDCDNDGIYNEADEPSNTDVAGTFTLNCAAIDASAVNGPGMVPIGIRLTDEYGAVSQNNAYSVTVNNVAPVIDSLTDDGPAEEGGIVRIDVSASDVIDSLAYDFDCNGDGDYIDVQDVTDVTEDYANCLVGDDGTLRIYVRARDDEDSVTEYIDVTVENVIPLIIDVTDNSPVDEGSTVTVTVTAYDPVDSLTYNADCNGDGDYTDGGDVRDDLDGVMTCTVYDDGRPVIHVSVSDGVSIDSDVIVPVVENVLPTLTGLSDSGPVIERSYIYFTATASDAYDYIYYDIDCDNNGSYEYTWRSSGSIYCYMYNQGEYTMKIRARDDWGYSDPMTITIEVYNDPPHLNSLSNSGSTSEASSFSVDITGWDRNDSMTYDADCNGDHDYDDDGDVTGDADGHMVCETFNDGTYLVYLRINDDVDSTETTTSVFAANIAPEITSASNDGPKNEGGTVHVTTTATDVYDTLTYDFDCNGDGDFSDAIDITGDEDGEVDCQLENDGFVDVTVRANDDDTSVTDHTAVAVNNVTPTLAPTNNGPLDEGSGTVVVTPNGSDPYDTLSYDYDCDNNGSFEVTGESGAYGCPYGPVNDGTVVVWVRANDDDTFQVATSSISINNVAPVISSVTNSGPVNEATSVQITVNATDNYDGLTYNIDCNGDGDFTDDGDFLTDADGVATCDVSNDGTVTVNVQAVDDDTTTDGSTIVTINNVLPTISSVTNSGPVDEGEPVSIVVSASDVQDSLTYDADCNGDGDYLDGGDVTGDADGNMTCTAGNNGTLTVNVRVNDNQGSVSDSTAVTVNNVAPIISSTTNNGPVDEGATVTVTVTASDFDTLVYDADCNGDGDYLDAADVTDDADGVIDCVAGNNGTLVINVKARDGEASDTDNTVVTVNNVAPSLTSASSDSYDEGAVEAVITPAGGSDPFDSITYDYDCDNNSTFEITGESGAYTCSMGNLDEGAYSVNVRANDGEQYSPTRTATVTVANVAPSLTSASSDGPHDEGSVSALITPEGGSDPIDSLTYDFDCDNDSTFEVTGQEGTYTCNLGTKNDGTYYTGVRVFDGTDYGPTRTAEITVQNIAPAITLISNDGPVDEGSGSVNISVAAGDAFDSLTYDYDCNNSDSWALDQGASYSCSYTDQNDGSFTVAVRVNDDDTSTVDYTVVTVENIAPSISIVSNDGPVNEGGTVTVTIIAAVDFDTLTYDADCNGDGDYLDAEDVTGDADGVIDCTVGNDGLQTINVRAGDDSDSDSDSTVVTVNNVAPSITGVSNDGPVDEGGEVTVTITAAADYDTLSYSADCNGDGDYLDAGDVTGDEDGVIACTVGNDGSLTINVSISDGMAGDSDSTTVTVNNVAPSLTSASAESSPNEGSVSVSIAPSGGYDPIDSITYEYDCNDDMTFEITGQSDSYTCDLGSKNDGSYEVNVRAYDGVDYSATRTATVTVINTAPAISLVTNDGPVGEGDGSVTIDVTASDAFDGLTYDYDCSNSGDWVLNQGASYSCSYSSQNNGTFTVAVRVNDDDTSSGDTTTVTVENVAPSITGVTNNGPVDEGGTVKVTIAAATDYDTLTYDADCNGDADYTDDEDVIDDADGVIDCDVGDNGSLTINVRVYDGTEYDSDSTTLSVNNVAPTLTSASAVGPQNEGAVSVTITPAGGSDPVDTLTYDYDCNDDLTFEITGEAGAYSCNLGSINDGSYNVNVRANDGIDYSPTRTAVVTVNNIAPTISLVTNDGPVNEGSGMVSIDVSATDAYDSLTYDYDCDNSGSWALDQGANYSCSYSSENDGSFTVAVRVNDDDTSTGDSTIVTVENIAPSITGVTNNGPVDEGGAVTVTITTAADLDAITYDADCNGDSDYEDTEDVTGDADGVIDCNVGDNGLQTINVRANDDSGSDSDSTEVTVNNIAPSINGVTNSGPVDEGGTVTVTITADADYDSLTFAADCNGDGDYADDGDVAGDEDGVIECVVGDDGSLTINVQADDATETDADSTTVTIDNVAPELTSASANGAQDEGPVSVLITPDGGSDPVDSITYDYDCNDDATFEVTGQAGVYTCDLGTKNDGSYNVGVRAYDGDDYSTTRTAIVTVNSTAPSISLVTNDGPVEEGDGAVTIDVSATDAFDSLTYDYDCLNNGSWLFDMGPSYSCAYTSQNNGSFTVAVRVNDDDTSVLDSTTVNVNNVPPSITGVTNNGPVDEGGTVTVTINAATDLDTLSYAADCNGDGDYDDAADVTGDSDGIIDCDVEDDGLLTINVRVSDDQDSDSGFTDVTILNVAPTLTSAVADGPQNEGTVAALITPEGGSDPIDGLTYEYDCDDDSTFEITGQTGAYICSLGSKNDGDYSVNVRAFDDDDYSTTRTAIVTVNNTAPSISLVTNDGPVDEGDGTVTIDITASDAFDSLTYDYDCDNSGSWTLDQGASYDCPYDSQNNGSFTVAVRVNDDDTSTSDSTTVEVNNLAPVITNVTNNGPVDEGGTVGVTIETAADFDTLTYAADCNGDGDYDDAADVTGDADGIIECGVTNDGAQTINVRASDDASNTFDSTTVTVNNVAPAISLVANGGPVNEGSGTVTIDVTASDAFDSLTYDYDCDNSGSWTLDQGAGYDCPYNDQNNGSFTVAVRVNDDDTSTGDTTVVEVLNVAPVISSVSNSGPVEEGQPITITVSADDFDSMTYDVDCNGDGDYDDSEDVLADDDGIIDCTAGNDGSLDIAVRVNDDTTDSSSNTVVTVNNVAPVIDNVANNGPVDEGGAIEVTVTADDFDSLTYDADCNGDGDYDDTEDVLDDEDGILECTAGNDGSLTINVRANDDTTYETSFTILTVNNVAPQISLVTNNGSVAEGSGTVTIAVTATDAIDNLTYDYDCNNSGLWALDKGAAYDCSYSNLNDGSFTVAVRVNDDDSSSNDLTVVTVDNVAPALAPIDNGPVEEGSGTVIVTPNGSDNIDTLTYDYDCDNDGIFEVTGQAGAYECTYGPIDDGTITIGVRANDDDTFTISSADVTIENVDPTIAPNIGNGPYYEASTITCAINYSDIEEDTPPVSTTYDWNVSGAWLGLDSSTIEGANFDADQTVYCRVTVDDGDGGVVGPVESNHIVIGNDSDGDGLFDQWELDNFGDLSANAGDDPDGDGRDNITEQGDASDPQSYSGPGAPSLNYPADLAEVDSPMPTLSVNNASDPLPDETFIYTFEVFSDVTLTDMVAGVSSVTETVSTTSWTVDTELTENASYYWRARATDGYTSGPYSEVYSFMVNIANDAPQSPADNTIDPLAGGEVTSTTPLLTVGNANDADTDPLIYSFEICDSSQCDNVIESGDRTQGDQGSTGYQVGNDLDENTTYYWQVWVTDNEGVSSPIAGPFEFFVNTINEAPPIPEITSISDGDELNNNEISIEIYAVIDPEGEAVTYDYQLDSSNTFGSDDLMEMIDRAETHAQFDRLSDNTTYYVRVRARDENGASNGYSATISFFINTANDDPVAPTISNPADGQVLTSLRPTLTCINTTDADQDDLVYTIRIYDEEEAAVPIFSSNDLAEGSGSTSLTLTEDLFDNELYWWTCQATDDNAAASPESTRQTFIINEGNDLPAAPKILSPDNGTVITTTLQPRLILENSADSDGDELTYTFEIYSDLELSNPVTSVVRLAPQALPTVVALNRSIGVVGGMVPGWQVDIELEEDRTYYWRATAYDGTDRGAYSMTYSFTIDTLPEEIDEENHTDGIENGDDDDDLSMNDIDDEQLGGDINKRHGCGCSITEQSNQKGDMADFLFLLLLIGLPFLAGKNRLARKRNGSMK